MSADGRRGGRDGDDWVERVRAASDIVEIVGQSVPLRRVGRNWMGRCPFHEERTPSFSVNAERQFYHCFSCKAGGDVFKFVQETEKVGFLEAVEMLSRRAGIAVPERRAGERGRRAPLLEALDAAATAYAQWLGDPQAGAGARAYLERRGIGREAQREFRLGFAPPGWDNLVPRLRGRFPDEVLLEARLAGRKEGARSLYDWFRNRVMVPLVAPGGAVLGFGARALGEETPKYLNSPESPVYHKGQFLYALEQARRHVAPDGEVVVVEGYFDAIALHQAGVRNTVATSGTALTPDHARALRRLARGVALTYDGDAAGQEATLRSLGVLLAAGLDVAVVDLPAGDDPDTLVRREGAAGWGIVRDSAYDPVEFVHRHVLGGARGGDAAERALQAVVRLLAGVDDAVRQKRLVDRADEVLGHALRGSSGEAHRVIAAAVAGARRGQGAGAPLAAAVGARRRVVAEVERNVLRALLRAPAALAEARTQLAPEDFEDEAAAALAAWVWAGGEGEPPEGEPGALARELLAGGDEAMDWAAEAAGAVRRIRIRNLQRERRSLQARLRSARGGEQDEVMARIQAVSGRLRELTTS